MINLFKITKKKDISLKLQLFQAIKIHNVFYPYLLQKASIDLLTSQEKKPAPLVIINKEDKWEVEYIFDTRNYQGRIQYQVK